MLDLVTARTVNDGELSFVEAYQQLSNEKWITSVPGQSALR